MCAYIGGSVGLDINQFHPLDNNYNKLLLHSEANAFLQYICTFALRLNPISQVPFTLAMMSWSSSINASLIASANSSSESGSVECCLDAEALLMALPT